MLSLPTAFKKSTHQLVTSLARVEIHPLWMTVTEMFDLWHMSLEKELCVEIWFIFSSYGD